MIKRFNLANNKSYSEAMFLYRLNNNLRPEGIIESLYSDEKIRVYRVLSAILILNIYESNSTKPRRSFLEISAFRNKKIHRAKAELESSTNMSLEEVVQHGR